MNRNFTPGCTTSATRSNCRSNARFRRSSWTMKLIIYRRPSASSRDARPLRLRRDSTRSSSSSIATLRKRDAIWPALRNDERLP